MDIRLLDALNNLSFALEEISEALKDGNSAKTDVAKALSGGDFSKFIGEIKIGIDELKQSVSEVSLKQETILEMTKENSKKLDVQTDLIKKQSNILQGIQTEIKSNNDKNPIDTTNEKNQSGIKKGIATILLIAVAVLAIGIAFKLIGGVNFLSVIALSAGIYIVALAFERIANMNLSPKRALEASLLMVIMSGAIMVSSWLLSMVSPMSISQVLTSISIAGLFYFVLPVMMNVMDSMMNPVTLTLPNGTKIKTTKVNVGKLVSTAIFLPVLMFTMSMGIMLASRVLSGVRPMGIGQIITSLLIAGMFALAAPAIVKVVESIGQNKLGFAKLFQISLILPLVLLGISFAIMLSSYVLGMVRPIGLAQAITAILIAGMFAVISFGIGKLLNAFSDISPSKAIISAFLIPILMTAISIAVMLSSWALGLVKPISFSQFLTSLGISIIFIAFSFSMKMIADSVSKFSPMEIIMLPLLFTAFSLSIMLSSWVLSMVKPITTAQFLTALGVSAIFVVIAFSIKLIGSNLNKIDIGSVWKIPLIFTAFSLAIMLSSHILSASADISAGKILKLLFFSAVLGISAVIIGLSIWVLNKLNLKISDIIKGGIVIVMIATTIMLSSLILSAGDYSNYPGLGWSIGVAASLVAFGLGAFAIGTFVTGPQAIATLAGLGAIIAIAGTVALTSFILSSGKYDKYPGLGWSLSVALSVGGFGIAALGVGMAILATAGIGAIALGIGLAAIVTIASTIVAVSYILGAGKYDKYPTVGWVASVGLAGVAFGIPAMALGVAILGTFGLGMVALEAGLSGILLIASTIVATSYILGAGKYDKYPTLAWISSVGLAGTAFGLPALALGVAILGTFGLGMVALEAGLSGILLISSTIVAVSYILGAGKYDKYPTASWVGSVGLAGAAFGIPALALGVAILGTFGLGMVALEAGLAGILLISSTIAGASYILGSGKYDKYPTASWVGSIALAGAAFGIPALALGVAILGTLGIGMVALEVGLSSIISIAETMVEVDSILSNGTWSNGPTKQWSAGVSAALGAFIPIYEILSDSQDWFFSGPSVDDFSNSIITISEGIISAAKALNVVDVYKNGPTKQWASGISAAFKSFMPIYEMLSDSQDWFFSGPSIEDFSKAIETISSGIVTAAKSLAVGVVYKDGPTSEWASGVGSAIKAFSPVYKMLSDSQDWFFSGPSIEDFSKAIEAISSGIVTAAKSLAVGVVYKDGPTSEWASGVGSAIKAFSPVYKMLSDSQSWFSSGPSIEDFSNAIETISSGIVTAAKSLAVGVVYKDGPSVEWASGVGSAIKAFSPVYKMLSDSQSWFSSGPSIEDFSNAIEVISSGIVTAANNLSVGVVYKDGPSVEWASGVGSSIKAFMPVYKMLADSEGWFSSAPSIEDFSKAIESISTGIVTAAKSLAVGIVYKDGPSVEWSSGVGSAIKAFMPVYKMLTDSKGWFSSAPSIEDFSNAIETISTGIVTAAKSLAVGVVYKDGPSVEWASGVGSSIKAFMPVYKMLADSEGWFSSAPSIEDFSNAIETISTGIITAAKSLALGDVYKNGPTYEWSKGVSESIKGFLPVYKILSESSEWFSSAPSIGEFSNAIQTISTGIVTAAKSLALGDIYKNGPTYEWSKGVSESIKGFMPVYKMLSDSSGLFGSGPDVDEFKDSIISISYGIKRVGSIFSSGKFDNYPNSEWSKGISSAIKSFRRLLNSTSIFDFVKISNLNKLVKSIVDTSKKLSAVKFNNNVNKSLSDMVSSMKKFVFFRNSLKYNFGKSSVDLVADDMIRISKKFGINSKYFSNNISPNYMKNIIGNISSYVKLLKMIEKSKKSGLINDKSFNNKSINNITDGIVKMAKSFDKLSKSLSKFTSSIKNIDTDKLNQLNGLTTNIATLSAVDSKSLDKVLKVLESKSAALSKILDRDGGKSSVDVKKKDLGVNTKVINNKQTKKSPELIKLGVIASLLYNLNTLFSEGSAFEDFIYKKLGESGGGGGTVQS